MHIGTVNSIVSACELDAIHFEVSIVCGCIKRNVARFRLTNFTG